MKSMRLSLANGMEMVVCPRDGANVATIQCIIWAGSLDEAEHERGIAHFLEHMLFKGTKTRGVGQVAALIEGAGGDSNAYTTFDKTVFHLTLPSASAELGFDVLSDAIFNSVFDEVEFEKEREVILEEIRRDDDSPGTQSGRAIHADIYADTEAGRPIIGFSQQIAKMSRDVLLAFWQKWYQPQNMSRIIVGNLSSANAINLAEKYFGSYPSAKSTQVLGSGRNKGLRRQRRGKVRSIVIGREVEQSRLHVILGAPALDSPDCPLVDTAAYVLGGSDVSRLQSRLQEKEAIVNAIGASAYSSVFEGSFEVSSILEPQNLAPACASIARELALLAGQEPATEQEIERSRAAARIARVHREETVDGIASAIVAGLSTPMKEKFETYYEHLANNFHPAELTHALKRNWDLHDALIVVVCDHPHKPEPSALEAAFRQGLDSAIVHSANTQPKVLKKIDAVTVHKFEIGEGVSVIYREIPDAKMFSFTATTEGGQRAETTATAGSFYAMAGLLGLASKRRDYDQFVGRLEDLGSVLSGFSGKDSCGLTMQCTTEQVDEMIGHLAECMLEPKFPAEQWQVNLRETFESMKMQSDSFEWVCMRRLHLKVFGNHPYTMPIVGFDHVLKGLTAKGLEEFYEQWRDSGRWVFAGAGGAPASRVRDVLSQRFATFKPKPVARSFPFSLKDDLGPTLMSIIPKRIPEQAQVAIGGLGPSWASADREATDILLTALSGQGGRLFALREDESLAYSVGPLHTQGMGGGMVGAYMATAREKVDRARSGLERELRKISSKGVTSEELNWARAFLIGNHEIGLQRTSAQAMTMALMELYGLGWNDFQNYPDRLRQVSKEAVDRAAAKYFESSSLNVITVGV
jgi:zinc protease